MQTDLACDPPASVWCRGPDDPAAAYKVLTRHGIAIVRGVIPAALCRRLAATLLERCQAAVDVFGDHPNPYGFSPGLLDNSPERVLLSGSDTPVPVALASSRTAAIYRDCNHLFYNNMMKELMRTPLRGYFAAMLGYPFDIPIDGSRLRVQWPEKTENHLRLHQDVASGGYESARVITAWIALTPCGKTAPGLAVVPGTHHPLYRLAETGRKLDMASDMAALLQSDAICAHFEPGDVLFFTEMTPHGTFIAPDMTESRCSIDLRAHAVDCRPAWSSQYGAIRVDATEVRLTKARA